MMTPAVLLLTVLASPAELTVVPPSAAAFDIRPTLDLLGEQPLEAMSQEGRVYRFLWLPSFKSQRIICVRVEDLGTGPELEAKAISRMGQSGAHVRRRLRANEWDSLVTAREDGFWKYSPEGFPQPIADGATWIIEGASGGERLRVVQEVPKPGPFRTLGYLMFRMSGIALLGTEASLSER
jgi:hypothetical protein